MAINKVVYGNTTLVDLTEDTATEEDVMEGKTFHDASGQRRTGSATQGGRVQDVEVNGESVVDADGIAEVVVPVIDDEDISNESVYSSEKIEDRLDEYVDKDAVEEKSATDEFTTINGGLLSECKVALSPNQDLHGYDNPWVGGAGKNKAEQTVAKIKSLNTSGTWSDNAYTWNGIKYTILTDDANNVIGYDVDGTATARGWLFISDTDFGNDDIMYNGTTRNGYTFTSGNPNMDGGYYCYYGWSQKKSWILVDVGLTKSHDKWYPMVRLSSESDPTFAPYSNICPISGHTQVEVENHQKNLCDNSANIIGLWESDGIYHDNSNYRTSDLIEVSANTEYSVSLFDLSTNTRVNGLVVTEWDANSEIIRQVDGNTLTTTANTKYVRIRNYGANSALVKTSNYAYQLELGSTVTPYVPYNGYQVTVNLGGTYYSGTLDVVSGVFVPDTASIDLGSLTWTKDSSKTFYAFITDSLTGLQDMLCEVLNPYPENYRLNEYNNYPDNIIARNTTQKNVYVKCTTYEDGTASDFRTAMSGYKLVYELATPTPIQLSPTMVKALVGENHLSAPLDGQEITESKYKEAFDFNDVMKVANYFTLPLQTFTFTNKICNVNDSRVTSNSLVDVYFTSASMSSVEDAGITVESQNGKIVMTAEEQPVGTIQGRIKVVN